MRKVFALVVLTALLSGATGCRIGDCWREAWCSHCPQQRQSAVVATEPCVVSDTCTSCGSPCSSWRFDTGDGPYRTPLASGQDLPPG